MKLLFLTSRLPYPPNRGDRLRAFNFLRRLSEDHEIHLVSFIASDSERKQISALTPFCKSVQVVLMSPVRSALAVLLNFWRPQPLQALYYRHPAMERLVNKTLKTTRIDLAYIHLFRMAPYLADHPEVYRIVDLTDVISREVRRSMPYRGGLSRLIYALEEPRISRYERRIPQEYEETWLISNADRQALAEASLGDNIRTVTNGVDTDRFFPLPAGPEPDHLIFVGHMGVFHNIDAAAYLAETILPLIRRQRPDSELTLAGAAPVPRVQNLDRLPGVTVTGFVPDLNAELNRAMVFAAPLRFAAGVQNKVLEAMAAGVPVVTSPLVNEGVGAQAGREILLAADPEGFADQVVRLLQAPSEARAIGEAGRLFVLKNFNWENPRNRVKEIAAKLSPE